MAAVVVVVVGIAAVAVPVVVPVQPAAVHIQSTSAPSDCRHGDELHGREPDIYTDIDTVRLITKTTFIRAYSYD